MNQHSPADKSGGDSLFTDLFLDGGQFRAEKTGLSTSVVMNPHMEGWVGIPHGGIGMGAITDMAFRLNDSESPSYPFTAGFRLGGTGARISDTFHLKTWQEQGSIIGSIHVNSEPAPYMKSEIRFAMEDPEPVPPGFITASIPRDEIHMKPLPSYKNCFVCGTGRPVPGLQRKFHLLETGAGEKVVISMAGFEAQDEASFFAFRKGRGIHPVAFMALLDETLGWGGFMLAGSGAVTVRIRFSFYREVLPGEKIIFFGRGDKVRGRLASRLLFWASGGAVVLKEGRAPEPVATASGQWLAVPDLTHQMHENLKPAELTQEAFRQADKPSRKA